MIMDARHAHRLIEQLASDSWMERHQAFRAIRQQGDAVRSYLLDGARHHANWRVQAGCVAALAAGGARPARAPRRRPDYRAPAKSAFVSAWGITPATNPS
jgi:hypothetical protein